MCLNSCDVGLLLHSVARLMFILAYAYFFYARQHRMLRAS